MKKLFVLFLAIILLSQVSAQIQGVSNDKLVVVGPEAIGLRTFEFEPGFGYIWSKKSFDNDGKLVPLDSEKDSILVLQALVFRFTYGFASCFEIGAIVTSNLDAFSLGLKYNFYNSPKFLAAAFLGSNLSNESDIAFRNTGIYGKTIAVVGGFAFMNRFGESGRLSLDYDLQYQNTFDTGKSYADDIFASIELGLMFKNAVQLISGFNYRYNHYKTDRPDSWVATWNIGMTTKPGKMFVIILNVPIDIAGRNTQRFAGFQMVLTIGLD
jgi:hypothetical protein